MIPEQIDKDILELLEKHPEMTEKELADKLSIPVDVIAQRLEILSDTRQKVLIVDDELDTLTATRLALEAEGYSVVTAGDGPSAIEMVSSQNPDVILLDLMMPGMDGFDVCKRLRDDPLHGNIPIIMLTARGEVNDKVEGIESGADDYITKPFNLDELKARIKMVLRRMGE